MQMDYKKKLDRINKGTQMPLEKGIVEVLRKVEESRLRPWGNLGENGKIPEETGRMGVLWYDYV